MVHLLTDPDLLDRLVQQLVLYILQLDQILPILALHHIALLKEDL